MFSILCTKHKHSHFTLLNLLHTKTQCQSLVTLLGPPEIYKPKPPDPVPTATKTDPFVDLMVDNFNNTMHINRNIPMGYTENSSPTFLSSGNPCLDFFFHVVPDTPPETLIKRLELAWNHDPLKTLKLVCNLRGVRGTGKSDREGFYTAALWMYQHHPKTLASNAASLAKFGYFKDLLEILFRLMEGSEVRKRSKEIWNRMRNSRYTLSMLKDMYKYELGGTREDKRLTRGQRAVERFNNDPDFRLLHDRVSDIFAEHLRLDMKVFESGKTYPLSLSAKWCPSLYSAYDQATSLCETIARKVFPREEYKEYDGVEEAHYAYRVRDRLRKQVLVPLRKALELPEVYIGANAWGSIPYNRVASVAMQLYKEKFLKHDEKRFRKYLYRVKSGKAKIAAGALLPHKIIGSLWDDDDGQVAELQWKRMVDDMAKNGKLNNCLAICDVSGSMEGLPIEVSVALGLLVSELSDEPWKGKLITFSENPKLQIVKGDSLKEKSHSVIRMQWDMNTDFQKVFDLILRVAVKGKLKGEDMIKRLFVFSDIEFDQASLRPWETDYEAIVRKFRESGYGDYVPEIVFWNLRDSRATPGPSNQPGVALVSGFSKNLMKMFLGKGGVLNPEAIMEAAISGKEYSDLVVVD